MRRQRRTKVVATLGPASSSRSMIERLFRAGADVFRINMSHTNHDKMRELVSTIRTVESDCGRPIGILVDLQGPKLRLGNFKNDSAEIDAGQDLVLDTDPVHGRLADSAVVAMRADWTRRDAKIGDYLKTYGRFGIPFNVVYGPAAPDGVPLPELLTETAVLDALRQAAGKTS